MLRTVSRLFIACLALLSMLTHSLHAEEPPIRLTGMEQISLEATAPSANKVGVNQSDAARSESELAYKHDWPAPPDTAGMLLRLFGCTVVVLGLCVGSLWFGKPWLMKLQQTAPTGQTLHIEGSVNLGNRATLYLVKIGDTQLVAGTDLSGLKSLIALPISFKESLDEFPSQSTVTHPASGLTVPQPSSI
jgi:flagellar biogenesis protein FliO